MQRSIATVSLSGTLPQKLRAIAAAGFDGVEIFEKDLLNHNGGPRQVGQLCADLGIAITLFQPFSDFEGCRRDHLQRNLDRAEQKFDLMHELGTDLMLVCSNTATDSLGDHDLLREDLGLLAERAGARQLRVGYEGLAWGRHVNTWQQVWDLVRQVDHPALGVLLDSFHTLSLKGDPSAIAQIPAEKIFFVQMADAPLLNMGVLEWSRHFRCFPGQGEFRFSRGDSAQRVHRPTVAGDFQRRVSHCARSGNRRRRLAFVVVPGREDARAAGAAASSRCAVIIVPSAGAEPLPRRGVSRVRRG